MTNKHLDFTLSSSSSPRLLPFFPLPPANPPLHKNGAPNNQTTPRLWVFPSAYVSSLFKLVVPTQLQKYDSQNGNLPQIRHKIMNIYETTTTILKIFNLKKKHHTSINFSHCPSSFSTQQQKKRIKAAAMRLAQALGRRKGAKVSIA